MLTFAVQVHTPPALSSFYYYAITVPTPVEFLFYLRFSAELGSMLSTDFVTSTIEIEVVSFCVHGNTFVVSSGI